MPHTGRAAAGGGHIGARATVGTGTAQEPLVISRTGTTGSVLAAELWGWVKGTPLVVGD